MFTTSLNVYYNFFYQTMKKRCSTCTNHLHEKHLPPAVLF